MTVEQFQSTFVSRGEELYVEGSQCQNCHGPEGTGGQATFAGRDLLKMGKKDLRELRGGDVAMIFQDPMTSLNPVLTIGDQIG